MVPSIELQLTTSAFVVKVAMLSSWFSRLTGKDDAEPGARNDEESPLPSPQREPPTKDEDDESRGDNLGGGTVGITIMWRAMVHI